MRTIETDLILKFRLIKLILSLYYYMLHEFSQCMNKRCLFFSDIRILITSLWYLQTLPTEYRRGNQEWTTQRIGFIGYTRYSVHRNKIKHKTEN